MAIVLKSSALLLLLFLASDMPIFDAATGERCSKKVSECTSGDICDLVFSECRIKVGEACKDNKEMCIAGAMCDTGADMCICVESKFEANGDICKSKTAGSLLSVGCEEDRNCTSKGLKCAAGVCLCRESRKPQFDTGTCGDSKSLERGQPKQGDEKTAKAGKDSTTINVKEKTAKDGNDSTTTNVKEKTTKAGKDSTTINVKEKTAKAGNDSTTTNLKGTTAGALMLGPSVLSFIIAAILSLLGFRQ